jgi:hypothetical protein
MHSPLPLHHRHVHITFIEMHSTCLHGKSFVPAIQQCELPHAMTVNTTVCVQGLTSSHKYATSKSSSLYTDRCHIYCRNITCSVFVFSVSTCNTSFVFLWKASVASVSLLTLLGHNWTWPALETPLFCLCLPLILLLTLQSLVGFGLQH